MTNPGAQLLLSALSDAELWCFSFVTLFNLQGTRPVRSGRNSRYLTTPSPVCQAFSLTFFKVFSQPDPPDRAPRTARLLYQTSPALSSPFSSISEIFFPPPGSFVTIPPLHLIVNTFFAFSYFLSFRPAAPPAFFNGDSTICILFGIYMGLQWYFFQYTFLRETAFCHILL